MEKIEELKPCPFCGEYISLWTYISPWSAHIKCRGCGVKLPGSEVRTAYSLDEDVPTWAIPFVTISECAKDKDGNLIEMFWVKPTDSFWILGHTKRWNTRIKQA